MARIADSQPYANSLRGIWPKVSRDPPLRLRTGPAYFLAVLQSRMPIWRIHICRRQANNQPTELLRWRLRPYALQCSQGLEPKPPNTPSVVVNVAENRILSPTGF